MGMIGSLLGVIFGGGRNAVSETIEVFRPNAEAEAMRDAAREAAALAQFAAEFGQPRQSGFDRFVDGLNRLPRPFLAFGVIGLFVAALSDPVWFAGRMQGIALVPDPLWWLMGAIVSFYFGARHQAKAQEFRRGLTETLARTPGVLSNIRALESMGDDGAPDGDLSHPGSAATPPAGWSDNAALDDWRRSLGK